MRGCKNDISNLADCADSTTCSICSENLCNDKIVPENRIKCHKCTSCLNTKSTLFYCEKYVAGDECVTNFNEGNWILFSFRFYFNQHNIFFIN